LLPHANASMVSKGKFLFETEGIIVHNIVWASKNKINILKIFFFLIISS